MGGCFFGVQMSEKIKGITIELNGDSTGLDKAINKATDGLAGMQKELRALNKDLKFSPDSLILLEQKQDLLTKSIDKTSDKLEILKTAYKQAESQVAAGTLGEDKFRALQRELVETESKLGSYKTELQQTTDRMQALKNAADNAGISIDAFGDDIDDTVDKVERLADYSTIDAAMNIGDKISGVGDSIKDAGQSLMDLGSEYESAVTKATSYFGETGDAARNTANIIENVYKSGVGDSMDSVSEAVIAAKRNLGELSDTDLTNIVSQAIILEDTFGIDMNETLRGARSLMEQFGLSAQTAMDYIVAGTQNGLDKTNELGDNLSEYAGKFAQAGYSVSEYFQLLNNGLDGGAYNLDKVNDAINEVTTRLVDGTIADSIDIYSQKTQELFTAWENGEATQKQVIDSIVEDIGSATNQQDALNMAAQAFGTMAEDGSLKFITALTSTGNAYDNVIGKAQALNEATTTDSQQMTAAWREIQMALLPLAAQLTELAVKILPPLAQKISEILSFLTNNPTITNIAIAIGGVTAALSSLMPVITTIMSIVAVFGTGVLAPAIGIIAGIVAGIAAIIAIVTNWGAITEWFGNLWSKVTTTILSLWESLKAKAVEAFNNIASAIQTKFTEVKNFITETWTLIKELFSQAVESIRSKVITVFTNIVSGVREKVSAIKEAVVSGIQSAIDFLKSLPEMALQWGKDFIQGFINGIKEKISGVVDAVRGIGNTISEWLHFSRPDKGPLREYETWMPDFMEGLAKGIKDNQWRIDNAISALAWNMSPEMSSLYAGAGGSDGNIAVMTEVIALLRAYLPEIAQQKDIILDGKALVGRTTAAYDRSLGNVQALKARIG